MLEHYKVIIKELIDSCNDTESKLDLLTTISITTDNDEIFKASEEVRNGFTDSGKEVEREKLANDLLVIKQRASSGNEESDEIP